MLVYVLSNDAFPLIVEHLVTSVLVLVIWLQSTGLSLHPMTHIHPPSLLSNFDYT